MKRKTGGVRSVRLLAILLSVMILAGTVFSTGAPARADGGSGKLTVALREETYKQLPDDAVISVKLYQIGRSALPAGFVIAVEFDEISCIILCGLDLRHVFTPL